MKIFSSTLILALFFSCNLLQDELQTPRNYRIQAPSLREDWLAQNGLHLKHWLWDIDYVSSNYQSNNYSLKRERRSGNNIEISLKKQASAVVLVYPVFVEFPEDYLLWKPAGVDILWQEHSGDEPTGKTLEATWRGGFRSWILDSLLKARFDIRYFNSGKLEYYLNLRAQDPIWDHDAEYLIAEIGKLGMDWYDIRKRSTVTTFALPAGLWQPLDVTKLAWRSSTPELALGRHYFLEVDKKQLWELEVLASGEVLSVLLQ